MIFLHYKAAIGSQRAIPGWPGNSGWWLQDTARPKAALCPTVINVFLLRAGE
jgi:hypothetical protein